MNSDRVRVHVRVRVRVRYRILAGLIHQGQYTVVGADTLVIADEPLPPMMYGIIGMMGWCPALARIDDPDTDMW